MTAPAGLDKRLGRNTLIYSINSVLSRAISFIMLPVYTRYLTPADYGVLALLQFVVEVAAIALTAGIGVAVMRLYYKAQDDAGRTTVVTSGHVMEMSAAGLGALVLGLASPLISRYVLNGAAPPEMIWLASANFFLTAVGGVPALHLQIREQARTIAITGILKLVLQLSLNILFVVGLGLKSWGILWSTFITTLLVSGYYAHLMIGQTGYRVRWSAMQEMRRFGMPYQVTTAGNFVLTFGERFFLGPMKGAAAVGVYSLAYQFGFLLHQVAHGPFMSAWLPLRYQVSGLPREERDAHYARGFFASNVLLLSAGLGICLLAKPALRVLTTPEYYGGADLIPIIVIAYVIAAWTVITKFGIDMAEQTKYYAYATWAGVVATLILFVLLIPPFGSFGAAWATVGAFAVRQALTLWWSQRLWPVRYGWHRTLTMTAVAGVIGALPWLMPETATRTQLGVATAGMLAFWATVFLLLDREDRARVGRLLRSPREWKSLVG